MQRLTLAVAATAWFLHMKECTEYILVGKLRITQCTQIGMGGVSNNVCAHCTFMKNFIVLPIGQDHYPKIVKLLVAQILQGFAFTK